MTDSFWPAVRRRLNEIGLFFAAAATLAVIAGLLAWIPADEYGLTAHFPPNLSRSTNAVMVAKVGPKDSDDPAASGAKFTLLQVHGDWDIEDSIVEEKFSVVAEATGNASGVAQLELPLYGGEGLKPEEDGSVRLVLRAEHEGETHYSLVRYDAPPSARFFIDLDRPLYQPGQTIDARVLATAWDSGEPFTTEVEWSVYDPQGNLVKQEKGQTSKFGIAQMSFPLASNGSQGTYRIEVDGADTSSVATADVRPFRLPRFTVEVVMDAPQIEAGQTVTGNVVAKYTYGEPVADEEVQATVIWNGSTVKELAGKTDSQGSFAFAYPTQSTGSGNLTIRATVQSEAGRMEGGSGTTSVVGAFVNQQVQLELIPARRRGFLRDMGNIGWVKLTRGQEPVSNTKVKLYLPEDDGERDVVVTTDDKGLAQFEWTPTYAQNVSAIIYTAGGEVRRELNVPVRYESTVLEPRKVRVAAGETVEVDIVHKSNYDDGQPDFMILHRDGAAVAIGDVEQDGVGRVQVPGNASGLYWAALVTDQGSGIYWSTDTQVPIWVAQPGGSEVGVKFDQEEYRPGDTGQLELSFPAKVDGREAAEVAFGVVAVDEALYALAERPTQALHLAAREDSQTIAAVSNALPAIAAADGSDSQGVRDIAMTRYLRQFDSVSQSGSDPYRARNITDSVKERERFMLQALWVVFCLTLILVLVGLTVRSTWRSFRREKTFSFKRVFTQFGLAVAALVVAGFFAGIGGEEGFAGGFAMWVIVSVGWFLGAGWRKRDRTEMLLWTLVTLGAVWIWGCAMVGGHRVMQSNNDFESVFVIVGTVFPLGLWVIETLLWGLIMLREKEYQASLSLTSIVALAGTFPLMMTMGSSHEMKYAAAPSVEADYAMEEFEMAGGAAPPPASAKRELALEDAEAEPVSEAKPENSNEASSGPRVRSWFPETMLWIGEIAADKSGIARLPVEFPDSITTWRVDVWANTTDGRFGSGQARVRTIQTFFAEVELPTHLIEGDVIEVPVTLANRGSEPVMARLSSTADGGLEVRRPLPTQVVVAPNQRALFSATVVARSSGSGGITVSASADAEEGGDAVRREVQIAPDGPILVDSESAIIADGFQPAVSVPISAIPGTSNVDVRIYASVMADALAGLDSMLRQPTGCFEQTSSANYPNVLVLKTLRANDAKSWPGGEEAWAKAEEAGTEFVELGYQRMLTFQKSGGGFALYPSSSEADPMLTAYGLMQLHEMKGVTHVDDAVARRAVGWLELQQKATGAWPVWAGRTSGGSWRSDSDPGQVRSTSFILMGLLPWKDQLRDPQSVERALDRIEERLPSVKSGDALAYAANALLLGGRKEAAEGVLKTLDGLARRVEGKLYWSGGSYTWMGGRGTYADLETTSVASWAVIESGSRPDWLRPILEFLAASRSPHGGWGSTQATVWTLRTFERLRKLDDGELDLTIKLDSTAMARSNGEGSDGVARVGGKAPPLVHSFTRELSVGDSALVIAPPAGKKTTAMAQVVTSYAVPWDSREAAARAGDLLLDWRPATRQYTLGKPVEVVATVENPGTDWIVNAIIELPIPPGAFVDLDETKERFTASRVELLPTHIRVYVDEISPGTREVFPYTFVPMVRGRVSVPPMRAYPFYVPEPKTEVDAGDASVR